MFVEVRYFQFLDFDIHDDVKSRYLRQVTEREQEEEAQYKLEEKVPALSSSCVYDKDRMSDSFRIMGKTSNSHLTCFQRGFIAQLVEHHTGVMGSNPVGASEFFLGFICNYLITARITFTCILLCCVLSMEDGFFSSSWQIYNNIYLHIAEHSYIHPLNISLLYTHLCLLVCLSVCLSVCLFDNIS